MALFDYSICKKISNLITINKSDIPKANTDLVSTTKLKINLRATVLP